MFKKYLINCLKGAAIGISMIIPGVSGGTMAVSLNIYEDLITAIGNIKSEFKKSIQFLLPICIGMVLAFLAMYYPLKLALKHIPFETTCLFAGLMLGSFPKLLSDSKKNGFKKIDIISILVPLVFVVFLGFIQVFFTSINDVDLSRGMPWYQWILLLLVGALGSCALIIPGISGSLLLLLLGYYQPLLSMISALNDTPVHAICVLGVFACGMIIGFFTIAKLMKYLLTNYRRVTLWSILGFFIGSIVALFVSFDYSQIVNVMPTAIISIILFIVGISATYCLEYYVEKKSSK